MAGNKEVNSNLQIKGKINLKDVPNNTPTGFLVWNSEIKDIAQRTSAQLISDLGLITAVNIAASYYTKTQLQTSGQSAVHWGNVTNKPTTILEYGITDAYTKIETTTEIKNSIDAIKIGSRNYFSLTNLKSYVGGNVSSPTSIYSIQGTKITATNQPLDSVLPGNRIKVDSSIIVVGVTDTNLVSTDIYIREEDEIGNIVKGQWWGTLNKSTIVNLNTNTKFINIGIGSVSQSNYFIDKVYVISGNKDLGWSLAPEDQVADWNTTDVDDFSFIKNKPVTFPATAHNHQIVDITGLQNELNGKEPSFTKNTAFNKNFGTTTGTVAEGNHTHTFASITDKPTTIGGYGITDSYIKTQVDTNIKTAVDEIKISGRNLLLKSNVEISNFTNDYHFGSYFTAQPLTTGKEYTLVFYYGNSDSQAIGAFVNGYQNIGYTGYGDQKVIVFHFTADGTSAQDMVMFYNMTRTSGVSVYWAALYEGNVKPALTWTPAPEDLVTDWNTTDVNSFSFIKNKPTTFPSAAHSHTFASITDKPTTIEGYGITDSFKSLKFVENLDVVSESGIYRQNGPANAYPYSATLNLNSYDGRAQLMMNREGNGMIYRTSTSATTGTSWTPWITVFDTSNLNPQLFLNKNTDNIVDASTFKISNTISPGFGKFEFISDYPTMSYGDAQLLITDETKAEFNNLMIVQDSLYGSNTLSLETYFTNGSKIHFVNTLRGGGSSMMSIYNSNYGLAVDLDEENFLTVSLDTIAFGSNINKVNISNNYLTQNRSYELPNKSGEIALLSDIPTIPTGNFVTVDTAQTITSSKTFSESSQVVFNSTEGRYLKIINTSSPTINTIITGTEEKWYSNIWKSGVRRGSSSDSLGYSFEINGTDVLTIQNNGGLKTNTVSIGEVPNKLRIVNSDSQTIGILGADNGYGKLVLGSIQTSAHGLSSNWKAAYDWGNHKSVDTNQYLGATYIGGGYEKPVDLGSGKLKLQMLNGSNLGSGIDWNDVLWLSAYTGGDVKGSNALVFGKTSEKIGFIRQDYDSATWGTYREIYHTGNFTPDNYIPRWGGGVTGLIDIVSDGQPIRLRSTVQGANYSTYSKWNTGEAIGYIGADGGAVLGGGDGSNFVVRGTNGLELHSDTGTVTANGSDILTLGNFGANNNYPSGKAFLNRLTVGELAWRNYGNGHTITDVSSGLSPSGGAVNRFNADNPWQESFPMLVGWNGGGTYGVRVDSARIADTIVGIENYLKTIYLQSKPILDANIITKGTETNYFGGVNGPPTATDGNIITTAYSESFANQIFMNWANQMHFRTKSNGVWADWKEVWTTQNLPKSAIDYWNNLESWTNNNFSKLSHNHQILYDSGYESGNSTSLDTLGNTSNFIIHQRVQTGTPSLFPNTNNANALMSIGTHPGFSQQIGFSSDGNLYRRSMNSNIWETTWKKIYDTGNFNPANYLPLSGGNMTGTIKFPTNLEIQIDGGSYKIGTLDVYGGESGLYGLNNTIVAVDTPTEYILAGESIFVDKATLNITTTSMGSTSLGITQTSGAGAGVSLYAGATGGAMPNYGLAFAGTGTFGTHGQTNGDWATYFTMDGSSNRGWIFKSGNTAGGNVASISASGFATFNGSVTATSFYESSLRKLKENIQPFEQSGVELIKELDIVTYDRIDGTKDKIGIIADDTRKEFLSEEMTEVDLYKTIFIQAKAIQELTARIEKLENGR